MIRALEKMTLLVEWVVAANIGALAGKADVVAAVRSMHNVLGGTIDPHAAYLLLRGMKTLDVRVQRQNQVRSHCRAMSFLQGQRSPCHCRKHRPVTGGLTCMFSKQSSVTPSQCCWMFLGSWADQFTHFLTSFKMPVAPLHI